MNCYQNFLVLISHRVIPTNRNEWRFILTAKEVRNPKKLMASQSPNIRKLGIHDIS
jgi:hypothetical protein